MCVKIFEPLLLHRLDLYGGEELLAEYVLIAVSQCNNSDVTDVFVGLTT
jgi:hypothetical protein